MIKKLSLHFCFNVCLNDSKKLILLEIDNVKCLFIFNKMKPWTTTILANFNYFDKACG